MASGRGLIARWRSANSAQLQLDALLAQADATAPLEVRNAWLIEIGYWLRQRRQIAADSEENAGQATTRLRYLLQILERNPELSTPVVEAVHSILRDLDGVSLLCDTGLSANPSFWSELRERCILRVIPATPNSRDWSVLFTQLFPKARDARWLANIDFATWQRLLAMFEISAEARLGHASSDVENSIRFLISQVRATALTHAIRSRMVIDDFDQSPFLPLERAFDAVIDARAGDPSQLVQELNLFRASLDACRRAIAEVFAHFEDNGVSVDIEFRVEGILARLARIDVLLGLWFTQDGFERRNVLIELVRSHQASLSIGRLWRQSFARLARKVVDRSAETGEHYITRTPAEYRAMFFAAAGGGMLTGVTVYFKFFITGWHLPRLFEGVLSSLNYAGSFVVLQLLGLTLATKQPAMTAPALAARIDGIHQQDGMTEFVEETLNLLRSQAVAVFGNVALVIPVCWLIEVGSQRFFHTALITPQKAIATIDSFSLLGPTPLYAALTGVLLWSSSLIAGWADNWFVYRNIGDVIAHHRRTRVLLGTRTALRLARYMRTHISGFAGNISLGFLLGMTPFIGSIIALPLEVRHVTLSSGALASSIAILGFASCETPAFWLAVAGILVMALLNVGVSFMFAFQLALRSRALSRKERGAIYRALLAVVLSRPQTVFVMPRRPKMALTGASTSKEDLQ